MYIHALLNVSYQRVPCVYTAAAGGSHDDLRSLCLMRLQNKPEAPESKYEFSRLA